MGCGSSSAAAIPEEDFDDVEYNGYGADYVNYSYYQSYFNESTRQQTWSDYHSKSLDYRKQFENGSSETNDNGYLQYRQWYDHLPKKSLKDIAYTEPPTDQPHVVHEDETVVNLVIEHSTSDVRDCGW